MLTWELPSGRSQFDIFLLYKNVVAHSSHFVLVDVPHIDKIINPCRFSIFFVYVVLYLIDVLRKV